MLASLKGRALLTGFRGLPGVDRSELTDEFDDEPVAASASTMSINPRFRLGGGSNCSTERGSTSTAARSRSTSTTRARSPTRQ